MEVNISKAQAMGEEKSIGRVTHYYPKIGVAIVELKDKIAVGDTLRYKGKVTDFEEELSSMQIEHENVSSAKNGAVVGIKVSRAVRDEDEVFKL